MGMMNTFPDGPLPPYNPSPRPYLRMQKLRAVDVMKQTGEVAERAP